MSRRKATIVAVCSAIGGILLLALSLFLLGSVDDTPQNAVGVFLTSAVGLIVLALAAVIASGLRHGVSARGRQQLVAAWVGLAMIGLGVTVAGVWESRLPWTAFALAPLLVAVGLVKDIGRVRKVGDDEQVPPATRS
ncbi:hypothetical protein [Knoellia sinensis]|nr:hypothetical protein [Knoellia sinensis]